MGTLTLKLQQERRHVGADQFEHVVFTVQADAAETTQRPPLDLVGCIDVSGSMAGEKLQEVKKALTQLTRHLQSGDRLGLVAFSNTAELMSPCVDITAESKRALQGAIRRLDDRGNTNMAEGALLAFRTLGAERRQIDGRPVVSRVILFTDGHANSGLRSTDRSGWRDTVLANRGPHSLSCIGFGEDHDNEFLAYLAELGLGLAHQVTDEKSILDTFASELGGLVSLMGQDVVLRVRTRGGVELTPMAEDTHRHVDGWLEIPLDSMSADESRSVLLACRLGFGAVGSECALEAELTWRDTSTGQTCTARQHTTWLRVEADRVDAPDRTLQPHILLRELATALTQANELAESNRFEAAVQRLDEWIGRARAVEPDALREHIAFVEQQKALFADRASFRSRKQHIDSSIRSVSKQKTFNAASAPMFSTPSKRGMTAKFTSSKSEES